MIANRHSNRHRSCPRLLARDLFVSRRGRLQMLQIPRQDWHTSHIPRVMKWRSMWPEPRDEDRRNRYEAVEMGFNLPLPFQL